MRIQDSTTTILLGTISCLAIFAVALAVENGGMDEALKELQSLGSLYATAPTWMDGSSFTFGKTTYIRSAGFHTIENEGIMSEQQQRHQQQEQLFQVSPIMYNGLDYQGKPTKVFAWLSLPVDVEGDDVQPYESTTNPEGSLNSQSSYFQPFSGVPVPAVVLVHGRGGTSYKKWAGHWAWRGYASLVIAHEGQTDVVLGEENWPYVDPDNLYQKHAWAGPNVNANVYGDIKDSWMYHALADTILGNSLLRSFWDRVDTTKIGVMGIGDTGVSVATNVVAGLDTRFSYMMASHYHSEHEDRVHSLSGMNALFGSSSSNNQLWDVNDRSNLVQVPTFWSALWPQEKADSGSVRFQEMTQMCQGISSSKPYMTSFVLEGTQHDYDGQPTREMLVWSRPEVYAFANSVFENDYQDVWAREVHSSHSINKDDSILHLIIFDSARALRDAQLVYTTSSSKSFWTVVPVTKMEQLDCHQEIARCHWKLVADIPSDANAWYFNMFTKEGGLDLSSQYYNRDTLKNVRRSRNLRAVTRKQTTSS